MTWLLTYDLTGSKLNIEADLDFEVTLQEPYGDDLNMGPGMLTLRVPDEGGEPALGNILFHEIRLTQNFSTGLDGFAMVTTDLDTQAGPAACGLVSGEGSGEAIGWSAPEVPDYCQDGTISCSGILCGTMGTPPSDDPIVYDNECGTLPLSDFEVEADLSTLGMPPTVLQDKDGAITTLALWGTLVEATLDEDTPKCACP